MKRFRVLVGCETSGVVREAFRVLGCDAWSCDILPADDGSPYHIQGDLREVLGQGWDLGILHPPCTYLNSAGLHWVSRGRIEKDGRPRSAHQLEGLQFFADCLNAPIDRLCIENPIGCVPYRLGQICTGGDWVVHAKTDKKTCPYTQIIQPYEYGDDASKATCLWLKNLPRLIPTKYCDPRMWCPVCKHCSPYNAASKHGCSNCGAEPGLLKPRWANQTDSGQNKLGPSDTRWKERSKTYPGIAKAMAEAWSNL